MTPFSVAHLNSGYHNVEVSTYAIKEGENLFVRMNCAYCHGFTGQGGMGRNLTDNFWRYGGDDASVFQTIYAGSTNRYTVEGARLLRPEVALVHVHAILEAPQGPLAGRHGARFSLVLTKGAGGWEIAAFHNTLEAPPGPRR